MFSSGFLQSFHVKGACGECDCHQARTGRAGRADAAGTGSGIALDIIGAAGGVTTDASGAIIKGSSADAMGGATADDGIIGAADDITSGFIGAGIADAE